MTILISIILVCFSALFSGLTLGLMGLDVHTIKRKMKLGDVKAKKIYKVRKNGNLLLTTLLFGNVVVNSALSIFLGSIAAGVVAGVIATALIFIFGEILPQAIISRYAMEFGARTAWLVQAIIWLLFPICFPIAYLLDKLLGDELATVYSKKELVSVIREHKVSEDSDIDQDEEKIIVGALTFSDKTVGNVMTPDTIVFSLKYNEPLSQKLIVKLKKSGFSRFPVYRDDKSNVVGMLFLRDLVGERIALKKVKDYVQSDFTTVDINESLDQVWNQFIRGKQHLFVVQDQFGGFEGVISMEDVLEEIVGTEIVDENDVHTDLRKVARRKAIKSARSAT